MPLRVMPDLEWQQRAACRGLTDIMFLPEDLSKQEHMLAVERAREICATCPVIGDCRVWALAEPELIVDSVVAGLSPSALRKARLGGGATRRSNIVPRCGTDAGFAAHARHDEECAICRDHKARKWHQSA